MRLIGPLAMTNANIPRKKKTIHALAAMYEVDLSQYGVVLARGKTSLFS